MRRRNPPSTRPFFMAIRETGRRMRRGAARAGRGGRDASISTGSSGHSPPAPAPVPPLPPAQPDRPRHARASRARGGGGAGATRYGVVVAVGRGARADDARGRDAHRRSSRWAAARRRRASALHGSARKAWNLARPQGGGDRGRLGRRCRRELTERLPPAPRAVHASIFGVLASTAGVRARGGVARRALAAAPRPEPDAARRRCCGSDLPAVRWRPPGGGLPRLARLPRSSASASTRRTPSSSAVASRSAPGRDVRRRRATVSRGSTSAPPRRCSRRPVRRMASAVG